MTKTFTKSTGRPAPLSAFKGKDQQIHKDLEEFWVTLLTGDFSTSDGVKFLVLPAAGLFGKKAEVTRLIYRECYGHLIACIIDSWNNESRQCLVTGTPGVGKTVLGLFLVRHLFLNDLRRAIVYVVERYVFFICDDKQIREELGLSGTVSLFDLSSEHRHGSALLEDDRFAVIHDPERDAPVTMSLNSATTAACRAFFLSYGHKYISFFKTKNEGPPVRNWMYTPGWDVAEGKRCEVILKVDNPFLDIKKRWEIFGGCLRKWMQPQSDKELQALITDLDKKIMKLTTASPVGDVQKHTSETDWRGTIIQIDVPFYRDAPCPQANILHDSVQASKAENPKIDDDETAETGVGDDGSFTLEEEMACDDAASKCPCQNNPKIDDDEAAKTGVGDDGSFKSEEEMACDDASPKIDDLSKAAVCDVESIESGAEVAFDETCGPLPRNTFRDATFTIGSAHILKVIIGHTVELGKDQRRLLLAALGSEIGLESMYGIVFEVTA